MKKLSITAVDRMRGDAMNAAVKSFFSIEKKFLKFFYSINHHIFDAFVSPKAKALLGFIYFLIWGIGLFYFDPLLQIENGAAGLQMSLLSYAVILCFITVEAYHSFLQFTKYAADIVQEAKDVELYDLEIQKVHKWPYHIMHHYIPVLAILLSLGATFAFVSKTELHLSDFFGLRLYAGFLVFFAALSTILAYAFLILDVYAIRVVYNGTFRKYVFFYPVSTKIFREYNKIITRGLIRFWLVGSFVLFLTFIVVARKDPIFITVAVLAVIGFLLFTFYPFYITKKKIIELKMQTIASLVDTKDAQQIQGKESTVKLIQESPSQISTNYYTLYWSSLLAIISTIISLKDLFPFSF